MRYTRNIYHAKEAALVCWCCLCCAAHCWPIGYRGLILTWDGCCPTSNWWRRWPCRVEIFQNNWKGGRNKKNRRNIQRSIKEFQIMNRKRSNTLRKREDWQKKNRFIPMKNTTTSDRYGSPSRIPQCGRIVVVVGGSSGGGGCGCIGVPVGVAQTVIQAGLPPASI